MLNVPDYAAPARVSNRRACSLNQRAQRGVRIIRCAAYLLIALAMSVPAAATWFIVLLPAIWP